MTSAVKRRFHGWSLHKRSLPSVPLAIITHLRIALQLPPALRLGYDEPRTLRRHQAAILQFLGLTPRHSHRVRQTAVAAAAQATTVMTASADPINAVLERLRAERCGLASFGTLDRLVSRVRTIVHRRLFRRVEGRVTPVELQQCEALLQTRELELHHSAFQDLKEAPKKPSLTHLKRLLDHLD